jgi:hypothetical protein
LELKHWESLRVTACKLAWGAAGYCIWKLGNDIKHGNQTKSEEKVLQKIVSEVRFRIMGKGKIKGNEENVAVCIVICGVV